MTKDLGGSKPLGIIVATPIRDEMSYQTQQCLLHRMDGFPNIHKVAVGMPVIDARNQLAQTIRELNVDELDFDPKYVLWVDDDAMWAPTHVTRAITNLEGHPEIDILGGFFCARAPYAPSATSLGDIPPMQAGIVEADFCGFHWVMMRRGVIDGVGPSPFSLTGFNRFLPEDYAFCGRARKVGYKVFCHTGIRVAHIECDTNSAFLPFMRRYRVDGLEIDFENEYSRNGNEPEPEPRMYGPGIDGVREQYIAEIKADPDYFKKAAEGERRHTPSSIIENLWGWTP